MIIAGCGCRAAASQEQVLGALQAALRQAGHGPGDVVALATIKLRAAAPGLVGAAAALGVRLLVAPEDALAAATPRCLTDSPQARAATGLPSVAEAAALAVCGPGARLLGPRIAFPTVTCALARLPAGAGLALDATAAEAAQCLAADRA